MGCPVHIWLPLMAGLAPIGRVARDRLRAMRATRDEAASPPREIRRWAPIQPHGSRDANGSSSD